MGSRFERIYFQGLAALLLAIGLIFTQSCNRASAASSSINKGSDGVALKGYDPVAYFTQGKPILGTKDFQHEWQGAKWWFSTAANRDLFAADPGKYAPQYGG